MTKASRQTNHKGTNIKERKIDSSDNKEIIQSNEPRKERVIKKNMRQL